MLNLRRDERTESHDAIAERAADYFERRHFEDWSRTDQAELDAWLAQSTLHRMAWLRVKGAAQYAERLAAMRSSGGRLKSAGPRAQFDYRRFAMPALAAASIATFAVLGISFLLSPQEPPVRSLSTDVGGRNLLRFADGTEFDLNTDTAIRYRMTNRERTVWLDKGEVWFHVAHNADDPFSVIVGRHRVSDLGTEFVIRREPKEIEVALLAGAAALATEGVQTVGLRPGDDAIASAVSIAVTRKTPQQLADRLAWRSGMLVFRNTPLSEVVKEFNRYNATRLVIADPSIKSVKVSANLRADGLEDFVKLTEDLLNLRADRKGDEILFSREPKKSKRAAP